MVHTYVKGIEPSKMRQAYKQKSGVSIFKLTFKAPIPAFSPVNDWAPVAFLFQLESLSMAQGTDLQRPGKA